MTRAAASASWRAQRGDEPAVLVVGPVEHLGRVGDVGDQVGHRALRLGHRRDQPRAARRLGQPDVEAHVGLAVGGEVVEQVVDRVDHLGQRVDLLGACALGGEHGDAELDRQAPVAHVAPLGELLGRRRQRGRRAVGDERAAAAPALGVQVAALGQRGQRLAQRRAGDARACAHSSRSARQLGAGRQQAELDRGAEPVDRLLERRLASGRARRRASSAESGRRHSRSNPRKRSQSVTAASKAASSTSAALT